MKKKNDLKFLSQSVLLEESNLPRINTIIILVVFAMVVSFIIWSMSMKIDEVTKVEGFITQEEKENQGFSFIAQIPSKEIGAIKEGLPVFVNIPGLTDSSSIMGTIDYIEKRPMVNQQGDIYYQAIVKPNDDKEMFEDLNQLLMSGMETDVEIIIGSRTLLQYFLGSVFNAVNNAI